jgi:tetratricopeptide (TPR) repeat protein
MALLDMYEGKYREGRERLRQAILLTEDHPSLLAHARNHIFMSILVAGQGDRAGQLAELDWALQAVETRGDSPVWLTASIAVGYARAGQVEKVGRILEGIRKQADRSNPDDVCEWNRAEGEVALARGNIAGGLEFLQRADLQKSKPITLESLAHGYERSGDEPRAIGYYERLIAMRSLALGWEAQQPWIAAHVRVAEFYRSRGEPAKAVQVLSPVAEIWNQADTDLPLAREIRRLQEALHQERW